ncbi:prefoldin, alpha subunit [Pneumocystis carinii B80]|uniref:Prefoldin, alpha subunit n=1 Tax=Pneumocystis carinii (strain B80) TaxID=1408658 RepID=A0A0W4ZF52_PNEC8|nr:prefoldin, alpha subunit [Pneumocystis carinii B80]KTW26954.1 prefoldin, alpha subunit [Pneumocystis carinii B80]
MEQKEIDLKSLTIPQLDEIRKQIELELNYFTNSFSKLKQAQFKFKECKKLVNTLLKKENNNKEILIPLTTSLYVSGFLVSEPEKVMVDIGTGYYVEKTIDGAIKFYDERIKYLETNFQDLETHLNTKSSSLRAVTEIMQEKIKNLQASPNEI